MGQREVTMGIWFCSIRQGLTTWKFVLVLLVLLGLESSLATPLEENHAGELGYCGLCNVEIMDLIGNYLRPNDQYNELWFEFSNSSKGRIAFCDEHYKQLKCSDCETEEIFNQVMEGIKRGWEKEFVINQWGKEQIENYKQNFFNITIIRRINDEEVSALP